MQRNNMGHPKCKKQANCMHAALEDEMNGSRVLTYNMDQRLS